MGKSLATAHLGKQEVTLGAQRRQILFHRPYPLANLRDATLELRRFERAEIFAHMVTLALMFGAAVAKPAEQR